MGRRGMRNIDAQFSRRSVTLDEGKCIGSLLDQVVNGGSYPRSYTDADWVALRGCLEAPGVSIVCQPCREKDALTADPLGIPLDSDIEPSGMGR